MHYVLFTSLLTLGLIYTSLAYADCTSPAAVAGTREWFSGTSEFKLCDGTNWRVFQLDSTSHGACSPVASREWDSTLKAYKFCDASGNYKRMDCLENGLVGHWKLDESAGPTAVDSSGNGNNGTFTNSPTPTTGRLSGALDFSGESGADATNDRVLIGDPANGSLDFGSNSFSYGMWVYATGSAGTYDMPWNKGGGCATCRGYDMEFGSGGWTTYIGDGDETNTSLVSASPILNAWTHVMVVVNRPASRHITYVNGVQVTSDTISATFGSVDTSTQASIGASFTGNHPFLGRIDDVRIYNRALSATDVASLANGGQACPSFGSCSVTGQRQYDVTNGILWCDGTDWRAMRLQ